MRQWFILCSSVVMLYGCASTPPMVTISQPHPTAAPVSEPIVEEVSPVSHDEEVAPQRPPSGMPVCFYRLGHTCEVKATSGQPTTLIFPPGVWIGEVRWAKQTIKTDGQSETEAWLIERGEFGDDIAKQTYLVIIPAEPGLKTGVVIPTSQGLWALDVSSEAKRQPKFVALWSIRHKPPDAPRQAPPRTLVATTGRLGVGYTIQAPQDAIPLWTPGAGDVWDDGVRTYIRLHPLSLTHEAPMVYTVTPEGETARVNATLEGHTIIVPKRSEAWRLQLDKAFVSITRQQAYRTVMCPTDLACPSVARRD
jgi:type IV secretion system protein TrbG